MATDNPLWGAPRTHGELLKLGIDKDAPEPRDVQTEGEIEKMPVVGGLHHYYYRRVA